MRHSVAHAVIGMCDGPVLGSATHREFKSDILFYDGWRVPTNARGNVLEFLGRRTRAVIAGKVRTSDLLLAGLSARLGSCGWPSSARGISISLDAFERRCELYSRRKRSRTKSVLRRPAIEHATTAVLNSLTGPDAQRGYRHAIDEFVDWYCSEPRLAFNRIVVLRYRSHLESRQLAPGTINLRLGAVRRFAYEAADCGFPQRRFGGWHSPR